MENNKDIGKLFRQKIDQLEQSPNENGWLAIELELDKKEKRRVLPFWFWCAGIVSIGISVGILIYQNQNNFDQQNVEKSNVIENNTNLKNEIVTQKNDKQTTENAIKNLKNDSKLVDKVAKKTISTTILKVADVNKSGLHNKTTASKIISNKNKTTNSKPEKLAKTVKSTSLKTYNSRRNKNFKMITAVKSNAINNLETSLNYDDSAIKLPENSVGKSTINQEEQVSAIKNTTKSQTEKTVDNLKLKKKIAIDAEKDSITKNDENAKIITVFIYGSPTATGTIGIKSLIYNRLQKAETFSELTYGYGAYLCYQGTSRLSFRLGVAKNNLKFVTKNVDINTFNYDNIKYENGISNQSIFNQSNDSQSMTISQDLSYIEIPFEIKYKILDTKIGLNAIIGVKQLFLDKNEVYAITSNGFKSKIGQTNNLLKQTFGANLGLGLDYKISKRIKINLETMFQFNIKTTQNTEDSKPFSIGVLTGLEFSVFGK